MLGLLALKTLSYAHLSRTRSSLLAGVQLTGVDVAYFLEVIAKLKEKDPEKVNSAYLIEIIDRMF